MKKQYKEVQFVDRKNVLKTISKLFYSKKVGQNHGEVSADYLQALIDMKLKIQKMHSYCIKVGTKE